MQTLFAVNILLALAWAAITGTFTLLNILFGFALGSVGLWLIREQAGTRSYLGRSRRVASLLFLFVYELILSGLRVVAIVLAPRMPLRPGIVAYSLKVDRDFEIALLANLITLTPGTLSVDVSQDRRTLYIHAIDVPDPDALRRDIALGFERKILEAFR